MNPILISRILSLVVTVCIASGFRASAADPPKRSSVGDVMLADYFKAETAHLAKQCLSEINTLEQWQARRAEYRRQLFEMLSLSPLPSRTDLKATITGKIEHELFTVEKLHFQSMPGLYVTANLYLPKKQEKPAPAILYVCGHARAATNGISFGNKTGYQHHGAWFARNGYVCLIIDTIQLGEIEGIHHGTYREGMWWWNSRGYTPAGVEAWNGIRALDYLTTRPEVDPQRIGITGRSGGGAYSWWIAALDDRIKVAAPVAGITDLQNHVVDGVVEGHCDCMFTVNTYRWDYPLVAALVAPRPLLICNSDKDSIFPLDGVTRLHSKVAQIYRLYGAANNLGLLITEGPHKDTQDLQLPVFRWFNRHLKGEDPVIEMAAIKFFEPEQLKVFDTLPADERTTKIHEAFVAAAPAPAIANSQADWLKQRDDWHEALKDKAFRGWPSDAPPARLEPRQSAEHHRLSLTAYDLASDSHFTIKLCRVQNVTMKQPGRISIRVLDEQGWLEWRDILSPMLGAGPEEADAAVQRTDKTKRIGVEEFADALQLSEGATFFVLPRGIGPTAWDPTERRQIQIRRRFMLLGQTLDSLRVWDIRRAVQAIQASSEFRGVPISLIAEKQMGVNALYAALFEQNVSRLVLRHLPHSHRDGPDYLNVLRVLDVPQVVAMVAEHATVELPDSQPNDWPYAVATAQKLGWSAKQIEFQASANRPNH